jgi:hypothetical protein
MTAKEGWDAAEIKDIRAVGKYCSGGRVEFVHRDAMWQKMIRYKGGHRIDIEGDPLQGVIGGQVWFDIDAPRGERDWKKTFGKVVRAVREKYEAHNNADGAAAKKAINGNYKTGVIMWKEPVSGRNMRIITHNINFIAPMPNVPCLGDLDLTELVRKANEGELTQTAPTE